MEFLNNRTIERRRRDVTIFFPNSATISYTYSHFMRPIAYIGA